MTPVEWALVQIGWMVAGGSPGPTTLSIVGTSMDRGRAAGLAMALGILIGSASWGIAAVLGVSAIMMANAWLFELLRYTGAAYLMWLAFKAMKSAMTTKGSLVARPRQGGLKTLVAKGALIHLTNPKAIFSWGAIFALVTEPGAGPAAALYAFALLYSASAVVFLGYGLLFSTPTAVSIYTRARRGFEGAFALFFGAATLKLLTAGAIQ